jgi:predicted dehydrogenase
MAHPHFRVGIIGAGGIAKGVHAPGWQSLPNVSVVAVADINKPSASALAMEFTVPHVFTDYNELLKMDLDCVDICTPNMVHVPAVRAALEAGKHVICEKPLAVSSRDVRELGELADRKGLKLMTAQHHRFGSAARAAKQWADAGHLGPVYHARVKAMRRATLPVSPGFIDSSLSGGGPCMDIGVHALDLCLWLMGFPDPKRVSGTTRVNFAMGSGIPGMWGEWDRGQFSVEDFAAGFIHFGGPVGKPIAGRDAAGPGTAGEPGNGAAGGPGTGSSGPGATMTLETAWLGHQVETEDMSCQLFGLNGGVKWPAGEFAAVQAGIFTQGTLTLPMQVEKPHYEELRAFRDCIVEGKPSPVPWRETHKVIAILEAIYTSQKEGREIVLDSGAI